MRRDVLRLRDRPSPPPAAAIPGPGADDRLGALRRRLAGLDAAGPPLPHLPLAPDLARHLPRGGLACGSLHEVIGNAHADTPAALGFALALGAATLQLRPGPAVLVAAHRGLAAFGRPYAHGLHALGLDPARLLLVETRRDREAFWSLEEALRSGAAAAVLGAVAGNLDLTASRRLNLAAAATRTMLVVLRLSCVAGVSAALTRWRIAAAPAARDRFGAFAAPRWSVSLERCRNGRPGQWLLEWDHDAYRFRLARGLADRSPSAGRGEGGLGLAV